MINPNNHYKNIQHSLLFGGLCKLLTPCKMSFIVGSYAAFFSLTNCAVPLVGAVSGFTGVLSFFGISMLVRAVIAPFSLFKLFAFHVPGMVAAISWIEEYKAVRVIIPAVCMAAFIMHPVGSEAWLYTLYWLIPIIVYFMGNTHILAQALSSTFIAHAVGSTIWLYADPMVPSVWLALIPVVALERLLFAFGMTGLYMAIQYVQQHMPLYAQQVQRVMVKAVTQQGNE